MSYRDSGGPIFKQGYEKGWEDAKNLVKGAMNVLSYDLEPKLSTRRTEKEIRYERALDEFLRQRERPGEQGDSGGEK